MQTKPGFHNLVFVLSKYKNKGIEVYPYTSYRDLFLVLFIL